MRWAAAALVAALALGACSNDEKGLGDAPVGLQHEAAREIYVMPDTFPNLATVCVEGHLVMVTTRDGASPVVVPGGCGG